MIECEKDIKEEKKEIEKMEKDLDIVSLMLIVSTVVLSLHDTGKMGVKFS